MVEMKVAISASLAVEVSKRLAFETVTSDDDLGDGGKGLLRELEATDVTEVLLMEAPRMCVKGVKSLLLESRTCATFIRSTPTNF